MRKYHVRVAQPVGLGIQTVETGAFLFDLGCKLSTHPLIAKVSQAVLRSSRIAMNRNLLVKSAIEDGVDFLLMIDPDMAPDMYVDHCSGALSFIESSLQHLVENPFGIIGAPAVGEPPDMKVNVFVNGPDGVGRRMTHAELLERVQDPRIEDVVAMGTGLMLIHMPIFCHLQQPYFQDEYTDNTFTELKKSQDIVFTERAHMAGIPVWCNYYSFSGHVKSSILGCPGFDPRAKAEPSPQACSPDSPEIFSIPATVSRTP